MGGAGGAVRPGRQASEGRHWRTEGRHWRTEGGAEQGARRTAPPGGAACVWRDMTSMQIELKKKKKKRSLKVFWTEL